jgi:hypothetical protein
MRVPEESLAGSGRNEVGAKSPMSGGYGRSEVGGFWGAELKHAGFDAIVVKGRAPHPVYLWVHDGEAEIFLRVLRRELERAVARDAERNKILHGVCKGYSAAHQCSARAAYCAAPPSRAFHGIGNENYLLG